jgi:beta-N-acetylhexosaminidase
MPMADLPLGRLVCVGIRGCRPGEPRLEADLDACRRAGVGGVILFDVDVPTLRRLQRRGLGVEQALVSSPRNVVDFDQVQELIVHVRRRLGDHVFVGIDQEGGRVARLSPRHGFAADPAARDFAAFDDAMRREAARRQAERLAQLGFDLNFAPCVDLALEPANEIIVSSGRSYGADPAEVVEAAAVILDAHARAGVAACLKHFPGHGSSLGDTHLGAVDITGTWRRKAELTPYRALATRPGVAVMVAHVVHQNLDADRPTSLSPAVIGGLLRGEIGFDGVVVTDSIDMRAVADRFEPGEAAVLAVTAGADLVIDGFNLDDRPDHPAPALAGALAKALADGRLDAARVEASLDRLDRLRSALG